jgi:hypothetical protein
VVPVLGTAVAAAVVVVLPLPVSLLVVELSSSPPHAAKINKKMPIKIGTVNFCNFVIELPPLENWPRFTALFDSEVPLTHLLAWLPGLFNLRETFPRTVGHVQYLVCPSL